MKYMLTTINTHWEATQRVMATELNRLANKIAIQLHLVAESCTICCYCSRWPVQKLLDATSYLTQVWCPREFCIIPEPLCGQKICFPVTATLRAFKIWMLDVQLSSLARLEHLSLIIYLIILQVLM